MAFRDRFDKIISYFDTDDVSDTETSVDVMEPDLQPRQEVNLSEKQENISSNRPKAPTTKPTRQYPSASANSRSVDDTGREGRERLAGPRLPERPQAPTSKPSQPITRPKEQTIKPGQTQIAIKHPLRYEDASAIADAFTQGQCLLVDFEYMQDDAQARRCIDFLTGACVVANGTLQRVGATMFLLTPENVVVTMENALSSHQGIKEVNYDYDMKRR